MDITHQPFQRLNNINASSSSEVEISEMNSLVQSPQRGGSSDQQAAGVPIITASDGRRNEEQQHQIVDVDSSHGAGDRSSDKAKEQDSLEGSIKNGIIVLCSLLATFCLQAILSLPGGSKWEQLQSKPMNNVTVDQLPRLESFLSSDILCFLLSVMIILLVTASSRYFNKYLLDISLYMMGALITSTMLLFYDGLVLATNDHLAHVGLVMGFVKLVFIMVIFIIIRLLITKKFRSYIRKACSKIRD